MLRRCSCHGFASLLGAVACLGVLAAFGAARSETISVKRPPKTDELKALGRARLEKWIRPPIKDARSTRRILETKRLECRDLVGAGQDVLRVCGVRVAFDTVPDPARISGAGGRFDLSVMRGKTLIDPAPHDRKFFLKHMEALANYYAAMSYGRLKIEWEVFPLANDSAYVLPNVGKYNPEGGVYTWTWENLEAFFRDAVEKADEDQDLRFSDFDAVVIFHAGSDWQNDIRGDSPYDIPSFFISLAESISVDGGAHFIADGSVVPETSSQDGYLNGINGVLAHEIGHQLGLPDLYDTFIGASVVGYWDLMDYGSGVGVVIQDTTTGDLYYVTGILPGSLSVWSKSYLGWVVPRTVEAGTFTLDATELQTGFPNREGLVVPLSSYEYFMIENRQCDLDGDSTGIVLADPSADSTGVIMGPVNVDREFNYEYDWPLPGSGLLIWRIDRVMVDFGNPYDIVNAFPQRRGVTMVEADGIPDLGDYNSFYFLGSPDDPFRAGNNDRLADDTYPNTRSRLGCHTHIVIDEIGQSSNSMQLRVGQPWRSNGPPFAVGDSLRFGVPSVAVVDVDGDRRGEVVVALKRAYWDSLTAVYGRAEIHAFEVGYGTALGPIPGWPRRLHGSHPSEVIWADLDGMVPPFDEESQIVVADETGRMYAYRPDGSAFFGGPGGDSLGAFIRVGEGINGVPVASDLDADGAEEIIVGSGGGLLVLSAQGLGVVEARAYGAYAVSQPVVVDLYDDRPGNEIITYTKGAVLIYAADVSAEPRVLSVPCLAEADSVYLAVGDIDRHADGVPELALLTRDGWAWVVNLAGDSAGSVLPGWGRRVCETATGPPALADVNGDGYLEILFTDGDYNTRVLLHSGSRAGGWPRTWFGCTLPEWDADFFPPDTTIAVPPSLVFDADGDQQVNVVQGTLFECIVAWEGDASGAVGFPLALGGGCSALALGDIDGDGDLETVAGGGDGNLYVLSSPDAQGKRVSAPWAAAYQNPKRNALYPADLLPPAPVPGDELLVEGSFRCFPNPAAADEVTFTVESQTGGKATLEIFDVLGEKRRSIEFDVVAKVEKAVGISDLGNGLYVCRLSIEGEGERVRDSFKLAIKR